jgi:Rrf2 family nitric oxide-sensitive transcriptional repressor
MRLSRHSDYAFRMLMHAALRAPALTTVNEVARAFDLSAAHLQKVAQTLAAHRYLATVRGRSGGLLLAQAPERIRLGDVAAITEPDFHLAPCMTESETCPIYEPCVLRFALANAGRAFLTELNKWTLADLIGERQPLLFALETAAARLPVSDS